MAWRLSTGLKTAVLNDKGLKELMDGGQIRIFSGPQPASANDAETGSLLCVITLASGAMTSGVATNGLTLNAPSGGVISKDPAVVWSGLNVANGSAGWFRWYPNDFATQTGASTSAVRIDGNCGTSGSQLQLVSTTFKSGATTTIDNVSLTF